MIINELLNNKKNSYSLFLAVLCVLSVLMIYCFMPLDKINPGHDMLFHYRRFITLMEALRNGEFPVYIDYKAFDNYGYGARWFYPDLVLIPFAYLANLTSFVFAYKIMWFVMTFLCGIFTYKSVNYIYKNSLTASIASLLYTFSTYRLQDIYERAAVGEALSFTFLPIVFTGLYLIIKEDYKKYYYISIGFTLLIYTHLLSSVLAFITLMIFMAIYYKSLIKEPIRILYLCIAGITSILLSFYFLLPFIEQLISCSYQVNDIQYKNESEISFSTFFKNIFYPHTLFAKGYFEPYIGILLIVCISLRLFIREKSRTLNNIDILTIVGLIYLILSINIIPWDKYPLKIINFIQFPWRLFEFSTLFFSITGSYYISVLIKNKPKLILIYPCLILLIACLIVTTSSRYKVIKFYYIAMNEEPKMTLDNYFLFSNTLEYFPTNLTSVEILKEKGNQISHRHIDTKISDVKRKNGFISCNIKTNGEDKIEFPLIYYKGYTATYNNKEIDVEQSNNGLVEVQVKGCGNLVIHFTGTILQKYSMYISLIAMFLLIIYIYKFRKERKNA